MHSEIEPSKWLDMQYNYLNKTFVDPIAYDRFVKQGFTPKVATEKATVRQTPITNEGLLLMKKVVAPLGNEYKFVYVDGEVKAVLRDGIDPVVDEYTGKLTFTDSRNAEDLAFEPIMQRDRGDAFYCGTDLGHIIRVGQIARLENWGQVNCDPYASCVKGLHVGNEDYIKSFQNENSVTLNMFVSPLDIGTVAINQEENVMRVLGYFPHSIKGKEETNKFFYHPSKYAEFTEARWAEFLQEFVADLQAKFDTYGKEIGTTVNVSNLSL